ncbi:hypothetical protein Hanom_Chr07g00592381 [Helianthus anomalus]
MCTRNTYNMARNTYTRVRVIERNISDMQDDINNIREYMAGQGGDDEYEDMDGDGGIGGDVTRLKVLTG